jgi:predicted small lipoprotein YifL
MRAAMFDQHSRTRSGPRATRRARPTTALVLVAFCTLLAGCGQRGPLYYPVLPKSPGDSAAITATPSPRPLPTPQTRLLDGVPSTIIAAPDVSLPEAGASTMPIPTKAVPATTPAAGTSNGSATPSGDTQSNSNNPSSGDAPAGAAGEPTRP